MVNSTRSRYKIRSCVVGSLVIVTGWESIFEKMSNTAVCTDPPTDPIMLTTRVQPSVCPVGETFCCMIRVSFRLFIYCDCGLHDIYIARRNAVTNGILFTWQYCISTWHTFTIGRHTFPACYFCLTIHAAVGYHYYVCSSTDPCCSSCTLIVNRFHCGYTYLWPSYTSHAELAYHRFHTVCSYGSASVAVSLDL